MKAFLFCIFYSLLAFSMPALAASSVLVWPIYQVIESDQNASALWLENRGAKSVNLQIRVLTWKQQNSQERYADQNDVVASPPFATVAAGQRQLIRLTRLKPVPAGREQAYRIIIDEIPAADPLPQGNRTGLQLQMRYLLPLFLDGDGVWTNERNDKKRDAATMSLPQLSWKMVSVNGKPYLNIRNQGAVHARLSNVFWARNNTPANVAITLSPGFLGYVLPGQEMQWPLPGGKAAPTNNLQLYSQLSDNKPAVLIKHAE
ncbi:TPA: molecular chaperone [Serratia marcescens]|nr:molecular chaperone [Serratia marcescens]HAT5032543.1 molecular chaperone [Serratia marcescens]